jgi:PAS domain S-box-containing protein
LLSFCAVVPTTAATVEAPRVKRVLILHSFGRDFAPFNAASSGFRTELARQSPVPIEFLEASLETARFAEGGSETPFVDYLRALFADRPPDLLVPFGAPAMNFSRRHRDKLFPGLPLLVGAVDRRRLEAVNLGTNATAVGVDLDLPGIIENILRILPSTKNVEIVIGNSPLERFWLAELRQDFKPFANQVRFNWLNELSFEDMRKRVATLPRDNAVLYAVLLVDAAGVPHEQDRALEVLRRDSSAPIFGAFDSQLGRGIVGGPLYPTQDVSREAARLAVRMLNGEAPGSIQPIMLPSATPVYDARELKRWSISESRLPAGSVVQFREATIWQRYNVEILGAIGLITLQAGLIFILLLERKWRRTTQSRLDERLRFEEFVSRLSAKFVQLPSHQIDDQIVSSLGDVAQFLGFDFSSLSVFTAPGVGRVVFVWQAPGTPAMPSNLTEKDFPWMARQLFAGREVSFLDPSELPMEAWVDRATVEKILNRSVHCVPLLAGETPVGVLNVGTFVREQGIAPELLRRLRLLGEVFANALARKRGDESLRESEEKISLATETANLGVWTWDISNDLIWVTEKCREMFGFTADAKLCLKTFIEALHEDDRERIRLGVERALRENKDFAEEYRVVLSGGTVRWIQALGRGNYNIAGEPARMLGVSIDITERKRAESELQRNREELTHVTRVSALGELAASLAHELNQPLTAILSNAQAAQRFLSAQPADLEEIREILNDIVADDSRAGEVIRRLRALVKKEDLAFTTLDLAAVIREVVQLVHSDAILRNVRLSFEAHSKPTPARGDKVQLQQVVLNLLLNAFEAMRDAPSREREVMVRAQSNGAGTIEISVRDHGTGLTSDKLAKIFDPFYTTKRDGLGMGLAISRSIVEAHGGRLWAKNNADRGATFYFTIPAIDGEASLGAAVDR